MKNIKYFFIGFFILFFLGSCVTEKKAFNWMDRHPARAAYYSLKTFPTDTVEKIIPGEEVHFRDTSYIKDTVPVLVPCPPNNTKDTQYIKVPVPVEVPVYRDSTYRTDVKEQTVDRSEYRAISEDLKTKLIEVSADNKSLKKRLKSAKTKVWVLSGIVLLLVFFSVRNIIRG